MNINTTLKSMRVLRFKAAQPNDTRGYGVAPGSIGLQNFASESTVVEHGPRRRVVTNFFLDGKVTQWRCHSSPSVAEAEHRSGHRVGRHFPAVLYQHQFLITHTDNKLARCIDRCDSERRRN